MSFLPTQSHGTEIAAGICRFALRCVLCLPAVLGLASRAWAAGEVKAMISAHCVECHGAESPEAGLDLTKLTGKLAEPKIFDGWMRVLDRVAKREMPPKDAKQPSDDDRAAFVKFLNQKLHETSLVKQEREGCAVLRRLNRYEYEHMLHDLLGIAVPLAALLPEDTSVSGFDTVSSGLQTSAVHLVKYQEVARRAIEAALPGYPVSSKVTRWTGRQYLEQRLTGHRKDIDPFVRLDGDALVLHASMHGDQTMQAPHPKAPGR